MLKYTLAASLFFISLVSYAKYEFNASCREAYISVLNLKLDDARKILKSEKSSNPSNEIPYLIDNYIDFLTIVIGDNKSDYIKLKSNKSERLSHFEHSAKDSKWTEYCKGQVLLQWAFIHIKYKEYLTAAWELTKAYRFLEKNAEQNPDFIPNKESLGLLHILIGVIPDEYKWVSKVLQMNGDLKLGTSELEQVMNKSLTNPEYNYMSQESMFLLTFIYINFWNDKDKLKDIDKEITLNNQNGSEISPLYIYTLAKIAVARGDNDRAINLLIQKHEGKEFLTFKYLDYFTGLTKLERLDEDANDYFIQFINNNQGSNYIKSAYQKLAWYYLLKGDRKKYDIYMNELSKKGDNAIDEDVQAQKESETKEIPNIILLKARLLCDGGYFERAIQLISENKLTESFKTNKDFLEMSYRLGRAYHGWGKLSQAIPYYEMTIKNGSDSKYYFAANSALNLGYIYEKQQDYKKAEYYYKKCFSMKNDEYYNSIRQKAKSGLRRLP